MYFIDLDAIPFREMAPGVKIKAAWSNNTLMSFVYSEPGGEVPLHTHPHEQSGLVLKGSIHMTIGGKEKTCATGEAYIIPGGVEHSGKFGDEQSLVLDIFSPVREDYKYDGGLEIK